MVENERRDLLPALLLASLGHGHCGVRAGRGRQAPQAALNATADWLLTKEVRRKGDWSVKRPDVEPSGWDFEFANEFYPDIDDTAMVLLELLTRTSQQQRGAGRVREARGELAARHAVARTAAGRHSTWTTTGSL